MVSIVVASLYFLYISLLSYSHPWAFRAVLYCHCVQLKMLANVTICISHKMLHSLLQLKTGTYVHVWHFLIHWTLCVSFLGMFKYRVVCRCLQQRKWGVALFIEDKVVVQEHPIKVVNRISSTCGHIMHTLCTWYVLSWSFAQLCTVLDRSTYTVSYNNAYSLHSMSKHVYSGL